MNISMKQRVRSCSAVDVVRKRIAGSEPLVPAILARRGYWRILHCDKSDSVPYIGRSSPMEERTCSARSIESMGQEVYIVPRKMCRADRSSDHRHPPLSDRI